MPSATLPDLDVEGGYAIQRALVERRLAAGESAIGWKIGMASAVGRTAASPGPIYGRLLSGMLVEDGGTIERARLHGPHAEAEIAVVLARSLRGPGVTVADVRAAAAGVRPAIEVFATRLDAEAPGVPDIRGRQLELRALRAGRPGHAARRPRPAGSSAWSSRAATRSRAPARAAQVGDPLAQVAWLANAAGARGDELRAGDVILTGALAGAHPAEAGDVFTAELDRLGSVSVAFA